MDGDMTHEQFIQWRNDMHTVNTAIQAARPVIGDAGVELTCFAFNRLIKQSRDVQP